MNHYINIIFILVFAIGVINPLHATDDNPGYILLEELPLFQEMETSMEVQIGESMIGLVANNAERESPEFSRILRKLKQIRSFSFDLAGTPRNKIDEYLEQISTRLLDEQWEVVYRMREPETTAYIYMKSVDGEVAGMTIYSIDQSEQVNVINVVGNISLEDISELAEQFGFPDISP